MVYNPRQAEPLVRARVADLRREVAPQHASARRSPLIGSAVRRTGWMLVAIGLRLAVPREERRTVIAD
jgi:hypothetical protein